MLECKISTSEEVQNPKITWLSWQKDGDEEPLLLYSEQTLEAEPGYSLAQQSWETSMDVSLRIANTAVQHEGAYTCLVVVSGGTAEGRSSLHVTGESRLLIAAQLLASAQPQWWPEQPRLSGNEGTCPPGTDQRLSLSSRLTFSFSLTHIPHALLLRHH